MQIRLQSFTVSKRFALTISRGTTSGSVNLFVRVEDGGIEGWGEASGFSIGDHEQDIQRISRSLQRVAPLLAAHSPLERDRIHQVMRQANVPSAARSAIDLALYDWMGKKALLPLWQIWGLERERIVPISVTIGINTPEGAAQRVRDWLGLDPEIQTLKVKLGSPLGIEADQAMLEAVRAAAPHIQKMSVDANGGWALEDAIAMSYWLADRGITYLEQPLNRADEASFLPLYKQSPLPIFADESCFDCGDVVRLGDRIHGINIKLNKCGGLTEALSMIRTARSLGLGVMFGCYSDTVLMNTALAHLAPLADHLDLDSHLNLKDDPFEGAIFQHGKLIPTERPGLGVVKRGG
ncbi:MAG: dipeptide epimerase [Alkalinema sp. RU_4_3]|nr:dipeptide epimerase [Alkalinema sp. RU_4_3]